MIMDNIKRSFDRVKEDIFFLGNEIEKLSENLKELNNHLLKLDREIGDIKLEILKIKEKNNQTNAELIQTQKQIPADNLIFHGLKDQNLTFSTGNGGVPTDRQTNQQTDRHIEKEYKNIQNIAWGKDFEVPKSHNEQKIVVDKENTFDKAIKMLNSLDAIKKDIRNKFKRLTEQEFNVFTTLYLLEEKGLLVDYKLLSENLNLTESSIRDYISKLINKGIPIIKEKINNKQIILHISKDLKTITPLDTISKLRDL